MKPPLQGIEEWTGHKQPDDSPWKGIGALALLIVAILAVIMMNSCARLESIPFSVSYSDASGNTYTVTKPRIIREK